MATLRWSSPTDPDDEVVVFASRLPVTSWRAFVALTRASFAVRAQLRRSPGVVAFTLIADVRRRTLWTVSAWRTAADMATFVSVEPHRTVMRSNAGRIGTPTFRQWTARAGAVPGDAAELAGALAPSGVEPVGTGADGDGAGPTRA